MAQLVGLAVNPLVAAARLSLVAQVGAHSGRMARLAKPFRGVTSWDKLPNRHELSFEGVLHLELRPHAQTRGAEKKCTDSKRKKYANLERAFKHSPLSRIYYDEPRTQSDKTRLAQLIHPLV